jgi:hypothetical protein
MLIFVFEQHLALRRKYINQPSFINHKASGQNHFDRLREENKFHWISVYLLSEMGEREAVKKDFCSLEGVTLIRPTHVPPIIMTIFLDE